MARTSRPGKVASGRAAEGDRLELERELWAGGARLIAGVDEAGVGPLAGPVVAAAVVISADALVAEARDSKQLQPAARQALADRIEDCALAVGVGQASIEEIAELNVHHAGLLAMRRAVEALAVRPDHVLVDARCIPGIDVPQSAHVRGDARSVAIASASIIAKVRRDELMAGLAVEYPAYGFERHAGYATPEHLEALRRHGPCPAHRSSWEALEEYGGSFSNAYHRLKGELLCIMRAEELLPFTAARARELAQLSVTEARRFGVHVERRSRRLRAATTRN